MADSITGGSVVWNFDVNDTGLKAGLAEARSGVAATAAENEATIGKSLNNVGNLLYSTGKDLSVGVTLPVVALGTAIFKTSSDFEESLNKIVGLVGISRDQVNAWTGDFEKLGEETGKTPNELAQAMFYITSAGLRGQQALDALTESAKASAAGLGDTATVADAVTSAMNSYSKSGLTASQATDILAASVKAGKVDASSLAPVLGNILPISAALGVSFQDVGGALASMTRVGLDAATASTSLRGVLGSLVKPGQQAKDALASVGLNFNDLLQQLKQPGGIITVMQELNNKFGDNETALSQVIPDTRAFRGVMAILAQDSGTVANVMGQVANSTGLTNTAFEAASEGPGFKFHQVMSQISSDMIQLGGVVAPIMAKAMQQIGDVISYVVKAFTSLPKGVQQTIVGVIGLVAALGPMLLAAGGVIKLMGLFSDALALIAANPVIFTIAAIIGVLIFLQERFGLITKVIQVLHPELVIIGNVFKDFGESVVHLADAIGKQLAPVFDFVKQHAQVFKDILIVIAAVAIAPLVISIGLIVGAFKLLAIIFDFVADHLKGVEKVFLGIIAVVFFPITLAVLAVIAAWKLIPPVIKAVADVFTAVGKAIWDTMQGIWNVVVIVFNAIWHFIEPILKFILDLYIIVFGSILLVVLTVLDFLKNLFITIFTDIYNFLVPILTAVWGFIVGVWNGIYSFISGILTAMFNFFTTIWNAIYGVITGVVNSIVSFFSGAFNWLYNAGKDIVHGLAQGIIDVAQSVWDAIKVPADKIGGFFAGAASWLYNTGRAIVQGLVDGIKSMVKDVENAAGSIGSAVTNKVKSLLGIHSPSKVFHDLGMNVGQGFANGMASTSDLVGTAANALTGGMAGAPGNTSIADMQHSGGGHQIINNIGEINIGNEVDAQNWLQKLTRDDTITSAGLTSNVV